MQGSATTHYSIESVPLRGARRVFRARRESDGKLVVVKRTQQLYPSAQEAASLRHEFSVLSRVKTAQVARPLELVESGSQTFLVLEPAEGRSLDEIIATGRPDPRRLTQLALCLAQALASVHGLGVVHRDIKPHHFFIEEGRGHATLIDFGLATELPRERQLPVEIDRLEGTLAYIAPEQTGRTNRSVDRRSDLYSLGVTLYELCTGQLPFAAEDALELVHAHIARKPVSPRVHRPDLPDALERIILRLLAKVPDDRYQTAAGLIADLERVHQELSRSGSVAQFALGAADFDGEVRVPEKLYGREAQSRVLLETVGRVRAGARELTLISGPAGVGKSALVQEIHRDLVRGGRFVSGKFDQYQRGVPYSALGKACGELVRVFLAAPPRELEAWKTRLGAALGNNARVVMEVVPELALVLGEQPEVPPLPPNEAQHRFERSFRKFMQASACEGSPLVLFLDDLQWADSASLAVLELVLSSSEQSHLLAIGNYRDEEVDVTHPLTRCVERLAGRLPIQRIALEPLSAADVAQLVSDALPLRQQPFEPLARLLTEKTSGNPFFVVQFLERLSAEGHLPFEPGRGFSWDLEAIARLEATDNVVDLVIRRLDALPPATQELLRLAACVGQAFRLRVLSAIAERSGRDVARALAPAVTGGFLLPQDRRHRMLEDLLAGREDEVDANYRFAHDRVQQSAYATIPERDRSRVHLRIGRLLLAAFGDDGPSDEQLFEIVAQLNLGRQHVDEAAERARLAGLNLRAAKRAKSAAAHASVIEFASVCLDLLGSQPFEADYDTSLAAHVLWVEAQYLSGSDERALEMIEVIEKHARAALDRVPARNLKTSLLTNQGKLQAASAVSLATMELLGERFPDPHDPAALGQAIGEAFGAYQQALGGREVASLRELPPMTDPEKLALVATMAGEIPAAFQWNPNLMVLIVLRAVRLPLEHGTAPISPFFYALYGTVHNAVTRDYARSHEFGQLGIEVARRPEHVGARGGVHFIYASFLAPWVRPLPDCFAHYDQGMVDAFDVGDQLHALYCMSLSSLCRMSAGEPLPRVAAPIPSYLETLEAHGDLINRLFLSIIQRAIACLEGKTPQLARFDCEGFSEQEFEKQVAELPPSVAGVYGTHKALVRSFGGDPQGVLDALDRFAPLPGFVYNAERVFYRGLACADLAMLAALPERRRELLAQLDAARDELAGWARSCPHNFAAPHELLRAESLSCRGEADAALSAFEIAIERASEATALHHLARAFERCGLFHHRQGRKRLSLDALGSACHHYERWGARGKVAELHGRFPELARSAPADEPRGQRHITHSASVTSASASGGGQLDLISAMRATEAIASELRLEPLLRRLMQILVENAGATRGALVLPQGEGLRLCATLRVDPAEVAVDLDEPLEATAAVPATVVQYCARTKEAVVLDDASRDGRFAQDPFVLERASKSIICLPLCHHGKLVGLLYLENDTTTGAFHAARVERLEFLGGHAAASLQNARLYDQLEAANEGLERRVRERTAELSSRNQDMRRVLDNVAQGLLTIDFEGRLASERSRVVDEWFGPFEPGTPFRHYAARLDAGFARMFEMAFEMLRDGFLPEEVSLAQMPAKLEHAARHYRVSYEPIHLGDELAGLLIVVDDVTESLKHAREEAEQREELALCRGLAADREAVLGFFGEAQSIVEQLSRSSAAPNAVKAGLHTLKGSAGMLGLSVLAECCHLAEDAIEADALTAQHLQKVIERFQLLRRTLSLLAGDHASERIEVSRDALGSLASRIQAGLPRNQASEELERLLLEPLSRPLARLGEHARALAQRLGKGPLEIEIRDGDSLGNARAAAPLWAALVHLVRNAVDHGLEPPAERVAAGKPERARLEFSASQGPGETRIELSDDGRGIDWQRVRSIAERRGLPAGSRNDLTRALFSSGFSTRTEVTQTSGRGVGLDAVRAEVERLGGHIEVESEPGAGCRFVLRIPTDALQLRVQLNRL